MGGSMEETVTQMGLNSSTRSCRSSLPLDRLYQPNYELHLKKKKKIDFFKKIKNIFLSKAHIRTGECFKLALQTKILGRKIH